MLAVASIDSVVDNSILVEFIVAHLHRHFKNLSTLKITRTNNNVTNSNSCAFQDQLNERSIVFRIASNDPNIPKLYSTSLMSEGIAGMISS